MATPIRAATRADIPAILALQQTIHAEHLAWDAARWQTAGTLTEAYPRWIEELLAAPADGLVLVCEIEAQTVGYLIAEYVPESTHHWSPAAVYLHDIFVAPAARRAGLARWMMNDLIAWTDRTHAGIAIRLITAAPNEPGRAFFATLGFRSCAVEMIRA
ncbi:MAG: GNAT family N-acetyltransferase [Tepidisphaeraceae bacterium]